jgi:hypothetical protein
MLLIEPAMGQCPECFVYIHKNTHNETLSSNGSANPETTYLRKEYAQQLKDLETVEVPQDVWVLGAEYFIKLHTTAPAPMAGPSVVGSLKFCVTVSQAHLHAVDACQWAAVSSSISLSSLFLNLLSSGSNW